MRIAFSYLLCVAYALSILIIAVSAQSPTPTDAQTVKGIPKSIGNLVTAVRKHKRGIKDAVKSLKSKTKEPKRSSLIQRGDSSARDLKADLVTAMKIIGNIDGSANLTTVKQKWRDQVGVVTAKANGYLSEWYTFCKQQGLSCKEADTSQSSSQNNKDTDKNTSATSAKGNPSQPSKLTEANSAASNSVASSSTKPINPGPKTSNKSLTAAPPSSPSSATPLSATPLSATPLSASSSSASSSSSSSSSSSALQSNFADPKVKQQSLTESVVDSTTTTLTSGPVLSLPNLKADNSD